MWYTDASRRAPPGTERHNATVYSSDVCRIAVYLQPLEHSYGVLLKHRSLVFSGDSAPLDSGRPADRRTPRSYPIKEEEKEADEAVPTSQDDSEDAEPLDAKPHVHVEYDSLRMFDRELVIVAEPTEKVVEANPALFVVDDDEVREERQLQSEPIAHRAWAQAPPSSARMRSETPLFRGMTPN
mgnify:CR=1 FL=1